MNSKIGECRERTVKGSKSAIQAKDNEVALIVEADAAATEKAVVVTLEHTHITQRAVLGSRRAGNAAGATDPHIITKARPGQHAVVSLDVRMLAVVAQASVIEQEHGEDVQAGDLAAA